MGLQELPVEILIMILEKLTISDLVLGVKRACAKLAEVGDTIRVSVVTQRDLKLPPEELAKHVDKSSKTLTLKLGCLSFFDSWLLMQYRISALLHVCDIANNEMSRSLHKLVILPSGRYSFFICRDIYELFVRLMEVKRIGIMDCHLENVCLALLEAWQQNLSHLEIVSSNFPDPGRMVPRLVRNIFKPYQHGKAFVTYDCSQVTPEQESEEHCYLSNLSHSNYYPGDPAGEDVESLSFERISKNTLKMVFKLKRDQRRRKREAEAKEETVQGALASLKLENTS